MEIFAVISESTASGVKCSASSFFLHSKKCTPVKDDKVRGTHKKSKKKKEVYLYLRAI